jgi:hypothetical protein
MSTLLTCDLYGGSDTTQRNWKNEPCERQVRSHPWTLTLRIAHAASAPPRFTGPWRLSTVPTLDTLGIYLWNNYLSSGMTQTWSSLFFYLDEMIVRKELKNPSLGQSATTGRSQSCPACGEHGFQNMVDKEPGLHLYKVDWIVVEARKVLQRAVTMGPKSVKVNSQKQRRISTK